MQGSFPKRTMDLILVVLGLLLIWPVLALVAVLVWAKHGWPVFFAQQRAGLGEKSFRLYKFRTMTNQRDSDGKLLADAHRLTPLGRVLRNTSLDELPELYNVIKGDMALVGPRPLFMRYLPYYTNRERLRHSVKPGITGWAQIHGRNFLPWEERLALDVWYVENRSLWLDFKILLLTVVKVVSRDGVSADPDAVETDLDQERRDKIMAETAEEIPGHCD
ncbi:UDP-galactose phosphate transferase [Syntrophotalea acetylenivorans]|uniref:UDP-galactose phosphate transferase n=2 Tax=Syntrophotalea acetylenivorans TaxID=1842532 RepID=A0A1L3GMP3_9BACT|nr:UDP-galactose phosphate transferase [Syntrophotalea acetylenivorans]